MLHCSPGWPPSQLHGHLHRRPAPPLLLPGSWRCPWCSSLVPPQPPGPGAWPPLYKMTDVPSPRAAGSTQHRLAGRAVVSIVLADAAPVERSAGAWYIRRDQQLGVLAPLPAPAEVLRLLRLGRGPPPYLSVKPRQGTCAVPRLYPEPRRRGQQPRAWPPGHTWDCTDMWESLPAFPEPPLSCSQALLCVRTAPDALPMLGCTEL